MCTMMTSQILKFVDSPKVRKSEYLKTEEFFFHKNPFIRHLCILAEVTFKMLLPAFSFLFFLFCLVDCL